MPDPTGLKIVSFAGIWLVASVDDGMLFRSFKCSRAQRSPNEVINSSGCKPAYLAQYAHSVVDFYLA